MKKNLNDTYEYKEAPMRSALEYASFGWQIGKNSEHYSKKLKKEVVTLRRDFAIGANATIRDCEKDYLKLESGKLPAKYKTHVIPRFIGKLFLVVLTMALILAGAVMATVGIYDGLKVEKRTWAVYNTAVEVGLTEQPYYVLESEKGIIMPDAYSDFVKENPTLDTYSELIEYSKGKVSAARLEKTYENWLEKFGLIKDAADKEGIKKADPTAVKVDGEYPEDDSVVTGVFDMVRSVNIFPKSGSYFSGMPLWINIESVVGVAFLLLFIILIIIEVSVKKSMKKKIKRRCLTYMKECTRIASDALYEQKMESKELMTRKDRQLYDLETMFTQVMDPHGDDYD